METYPRISLDAWVKVGEGGNGITYENPTDPKIILKVNSLSPGFALKTRSGLAKWRGFPVRRGKTVEIAALPSCEKNFFASAKIRKNREKCREITGYFRHGTF
ncbi:MAG: hypothetical protein IJ753_08980 [Bacteroidales bacterium]|nr:hypothetical protein [Bacteroidales bacterium]MBR1783630.1 hypothetical protein [Bacteroidales bacterium]